MELVNLYPLTLPAEYKYILHLWNCSSEEKATNLENEIIIHKNDKWLPFEISEEYLPIKKKQRNKPHPKMNKRKTLSV